MYQERMKQIEADVVPFGFIDDGSDVIDEIESREDWERKRWQVWSEVDTLEYW